MTVRELIERLRKEATDLDAEIRVDTPFRDMRVEDVYVGDDDVVMIETEGP